MLSTANESSPDCCVIQILHTTHNYTAAAFCDYPEVCSPLESIPLSLRSFAKKKGRSSQLSPSAHFSFLHRVNDFTNHSSQINLLSAFPNFSSKLPFTPLHQHQSTRAATTRVLRNNRFATDLDQKVDNFISSALICLRSPNSLRTLFVWGRNVPVACRSLASKRSLLD